MTPASEELQECFPDLGRILGRDQQVDVLGGLHPPPEAPADLRLRDRGEPAQLAQDPLRDGTDLAAEAAAGAPFEQRDPLENLLLGLLAEALELTNLPLLGGMLELRERFDPERLAQDAHPLGPEAGHADHLEIARRDRIDELFVELHVTGLPELGDLLGGRFADALHPGRLPLFVVCAGARGGTVTGPRRVLVRPDLEWVFPFELQEGGDLLESAG